MNTHTLFAAPVIPVMAVHDLNTAPDLARALVAGGITTLEITLRTPVALDVIRLLKREVPEAVIGAGTVLNACQLDQVAEAGAAFAISPGLTPDLARAAAAHDLPLIPGVATAGELMLALEHGMTMLKLFPAETIGGRALLKAFAGPFPQVKFCPTGGITPHTAPDYLALPNVACVGGSWLTPKDVVARGDWNEIKRLAAEAAALRG